MTRGALHIPTETERILIAHNEDDAHEIVLSNLAKKPFDAIMATLLKDRVLAEAAAEAEVGVGKRTEPDIAVEFIVPKEGMQWDFRRMVTVLAIGGVVLSAGLVGFIGYMLAKADNHVPVVPMLIKAIGFCVLMFAGFGIPVLMTYKKRERIIPAAIKIADGFLTMGEEYFSLAEIRRIVATPPDYTMGNFVATRTISVRTDRGKTAFNLGIRTAGGLWKTVFEDYGELCHALEKTAVREGFDFSYDL